MIMKTGREVDHSLRWRCPHCGVGSMRFRSAIHHMRRKHFDCLSCSAEATMLKGMLSGVGQWWFQTPAMEEKDS